MIKDEKHHMVITPFLKDEKVLEFYKEQKETGAEIMLDNGEFEDVAIEQDEYIELIKLLEPDIICLPDRWKDPAGTYYKHNVMLERLKEVGLKPKCMFIPHGSTVLNYISCTSKIAVNMLGPYLKDGYEFLMGLTFAEWGDTSGMIRPFLSHYLMDFPGRFHFLGLYNTRELWTASEHVDSIDSSFPFKAALKGIELNNTDGNVITDKFDFHAKLTDKQVELAKVNIDIMNWLVHEKPRENPFELLR